MTNLELADIISSRLNGKIKKKLLLDVIDVFIDELKKKVLNLENITFHNFGTISYYLYKPYRAFHLVERRVVDVPAKSNMRFHAHASVRKILRIYTMFGPRMPKPTKDKRSRSGT